MTWRTIGIAIWFAVLGAGCAKWEVPVPPSRNESMVKGEGGAAAENVFLDAAANPARPAADSVSGIGGITVRIFPTLPSRLSPPRLILEGPRSREGWEFRNVTWIVGGREFPGSESLERERFQKGDRVSARGVVARGEEQIAFETAELVARNCPPELGDVRLEPKAPVTGGRVQVVAACHDPDGDPVALIYKWFVDDTEVPGETGRELPLTGVKKGAWIHVRVSTNDGTVEGSWKYSPRYQVVNSLPVVKSALPREVPPDRKFSYRIVAEDPDGDGLTYVLENAPEGMILSGSTLTWDVPDEILGRMVDIAVSISDGDGGRTVYSFSMNIARSPVERVREPAVRPGS